MRELLDTVSVVARAANSHVRYFGPTADRLDPPQYAGKVETVGAMMTLDLLGVGMGKIKDPKAFAQFGIGVCLMARAYDEVYEGTPVDEVVTPEDLNTTPVFHKFAGQGGRHVIGSQGVQLALESAEKMIPGDSHGSKKRRTAIEELLNGYAQGVANAANNPDYHEGDVLTFPVALRSRTDVSDLLGGTSIELCAALLDVACSDKSRELGGGISMAVQFGDDLFDWRKDWIKHLARKEESERSVRPQENLHNATLLEHPDEAEACEKVLTNNSKRSVVWSREKAPNAFEAFQERFQNLVGQFPSHQYTATARRILSLAFYKALPLAPESGRFYRWAKY